MAEHFDLPPAPAGDEARQLEQLYRYLSTMAEKLNDAMHGISLESFTDEAREQIRQAAEGGEAKKEIRSAQNTLRSMIIKSAEIVRNEMEEIRAELTQEYTAISEEFGTLEQELSARIEANAAGIQQNYSYVETLESRADGVDSYVNRTNAYIFTGMIGTNPVTGGPVYGVAVGEGITAYDAQGTPYVNTAARVATFTKDRLSFWQGETEMAYFSDRKMYITDAQIVRTLRMGNYVWRIQQDGSMGLTAL